MLTNTLLYKVYKESRPSLPFISALNALLLMACCTAFVNPAKAGESVGGDTLLIPIGAQGSEAERAHLPPKGISKTTVRLRYGEPLRTSSAVGEPPISRWFYDGFTIYFEGNTVVHSVQLHKPKHAK